MLDKIDNVFEQFKAEKPQTLEGIEALRIKYLSKKGIVSKLLEAFKKVAPEQKREIGQSLNQLKQQIAHAIDDWKSNLKGIDRDGVKMDLTRPSAPVSLGSRHPLSLVKNEILDIFFRLGFMLSEGAEIEDDYHVFSALNFPDEHPARDMQDTFFIQTNPDILLRTHTSSVQVRDMETMPLPIRAVTPGRVFRNEAISARAHCIFHQVEALYIDKNVSFSDLKQTIDYFVKAFFGRDVSIRLRPSYFPFTEPSAEVDVSCSICSGKGCNVCKYTGWLEIMGCGMVDPKVLDISKIDSEKYTGFALGMGIERIAMLKFGINDLRLYFENDIRFLHQFKNTVV